MDKEQLKSWRAALGLTQHQAAATLGLSRRGYQNYELGLRPVPKSIELLVGMIERQLSAA